uniref:Reverse transcriptase Ty1/copia-type domain-containing protein n=1 Tax=Tanacetum cinerariifolium TaxID=118510 RepID=A0A699HJV3_TANCI|nr:hypothetical protein [Tanacetum cinerariifolium]
MNIEEDVYVCQPPGCEDPDFPDRVYKVEKALYGLHQAPKAWYETLSTYLLDNRFQRGKINKTLFIKRNKGELAFFLGLQVKQKKDGIFISQDKYVAEILKKIRFLEVKTANTPMETQKPLLKDEDGKEVDVHMYRYQVNPKIPHLYAVKRIFRDLQLADEEGIDCLPNSTIFEQLALMGIGKGFFGRVTPLFPTMVIQNQTELGECLAMPTDPHHTPTILQPSSSQTQKTHKPRKPKSKDTQVPQPSDPMKNVAYEAIHKELGDSLVRAANTASSLEVEQDSGEDVSKQGRRIDAIDVDDEITLVNDADKEMFDVDDLGGEEVFVAEQKVISTAATTKTITTEEITLAEALEALKTSKSKDKGKGIMVEELIKHKKKDQIRLDEEAALKLQAMFDEEERLYKVNDAEEVKTTRQHIRWKVYTDILIYVPPAAPVQPPPSPEWSSGSLPVSPSSPAVPTLVASLVTTSAATIEVDKDDFLERYRFRSLEREQERATMTFGAIWRLENHDLRMQIAEERRERLELIDRVARIERKQESRGE